MPDHPISAQERPIIRLCNEFVKYGPAQEISAQDVMDYIDSRFRKILSVILGSTSRQRRVLWWKYLRLELEVAMSMVGSASIKGLRYTIPIVLRCLVLSMAAVLDPEPIVDDDFVAMLEANPPGGHPAAIVEDYAHSWWEVDLDTTDLPDPTQPGGILPATMTRSTIQMCLTIHWKQQPFSYAFPDCVPSKQWYTWGRGTYIPSHEDHPFPKCNRCASYKSVNSTLYERLAALEHRVNSTQTLQQSRRRMSCNRAINLFRAQQASAAKAEWDESELLGDESDRPDGSNLTDSEADDNPLDTNVRPDSESGLNMEPSSQPQPSAQADVADGTLMATPDVTSSPMCSDRRSSHDSDSRSGRTPSQASSCDPPRRRYDASRLTTGELYEILRTPLSSTDSHVAHAGDFDMLRTGHMDDILSPPSQPSSPSRLSESIAWLKMKKDQTITPLPDDRLPHHFNYPPLGADHTKPTEADLPWIKSRESPSPSRSSDTSAVPSPDGSISSEGKRVVHIARKATLVGDKPVDHPRDLPGRFDKMSIKVRKAHPAAYITASSAMAPADVLMRPPDTHHADESVEKDDQGLPVWDHAMTLDDPTDTERVVESFRPVRLDKSDTDNVSALFLRTVALNAQNEKSIPVQPFCPVTLIAPVQDISSSSLFRPVILSAPTPHTPVPSFQSLKLHRTDDIDRPASPVRVVRLDGPSVPIPLLRSTPHTMPALTLHSSRLDGPARSARPQAINVVSIQPVASNSRNTSPALVFRPVTLPNPQGITAPAVSEGLTMLGTGHDTGAPNTMCTTVFSPATSAAPVVGEHGTESFRPVTLGVPEVGRSTAASIGPVTSFRPMLLRGQNTDTLRPASCYHPQSSTPVASLLRPVVLMDPSGIPVPAASPQPEVVGSEVARNAVPAPSFRPVTLTAQQPGVISREVGPNGVAAPLYRPVTLAAHTGSVHPSTSADANKSTPTAPGGFAPPLFHPTILQNMADMHTSSSFQPMTLQPNYRHTEYQAPTFQSLDSEQRRRSLQDPHIQDVPMDLSRDDDCYHYEDTFGAELLSLADDKPAHIPPGDPKGSFKAGDFKGVPDMWLEGGSDGFNDINNRF